MARCVAAASRRSGRNGCRPGFPGGAEGLGGDAVGSGRSWVQHCSDRGLPLFGWLTERPGMRPARLAAAEWSPGAPHQEDWHRRASACSCKESWPGGRDPGTPASRQRRPAAHLPQQTRPDADPTGAAWSSGLGIQARSGRGGPWLRQRRKWARPRVTVPLPGEHARSGATG